MSDLLVVTFKDEAIAFAMRAELVKLQKEYLIEMDDIVVVTNGSDGKVKLHQAMNLTAAGAASGGLWGTLVGLIFLNPLLGLAVGAGAGAMSGALTDVGIDDAFMKSVGASLNNGGGAVCVLVRKMTADKVLAQLAQFRDKGHVFQTSLSEADEAKLKAVLESPTPAAS